MIFPLSKDRTVSARRSIPSSRGGGGGGGLFLFWFWIQEGQSSRSSLPKRLRTPPQSLQNCIPSSPTQVGAGSFSANRIVPGILLYQRKIAPSLFPTAMSRRAVFRLRVAFFSAERVKLFSALPTVLLVSGQRFPASRTASANIGRVAARSPWKKKSERGMLPREPGTDRAWSWLNS